MSPENDKCESDKHINGLLIATNINRNVQQERKYCAIQTLMIRIQKIK